MNLLINTYFILLVGLLLFCGCSSQSKTDISSITPMIVQHNDKSSVQALYSTPIKEPYKRSSKKKPPHNSTYDRTKAACLKENRYLESRLLMKCTLDKLNQIDSN